MTLTTENPRKTREGDSCAMCPGGVMRMTPYGITCNTCGLFNHQARAVLYSESIMGERGGGVGLLFEQRCGKSRTAIEIAKRRQARRVLVLCPSQQGNVPKVWLSEAKEQWPDSPQLVNLTGTGVQRAEALRRLGDRPAFVVCNYESACRAPLGPRFGKRGRIEDKGLLAQMDWDVLITDEGHRLKDPSGQWQRTVAMIADRTPARLHLTGTPMHSPLDIWAQYRIIDRGETFGTSYVSFRQGHTRPATKAELRDKDLVYLRGAGGVLSRPKLIGLDEIEEKMYQRAVRVTLAEVFPDLPPILPDDLRYCDLEPSARRIYREMEREMVADLGGTDVATAANGGVKVLRLQQLTGGSLTPMAMPGDDARDPQVVSTAKEHLLKEILDDTEEPLVVFGRFHTDLDAIHRACEAAGKSSLELSGRRGELEQWKAGEAQVLVTQIQAGGVGIDLTRAALIVYYSMGGSLIDYEQSRSRPLGPRQTRPVSYVFLLASRTVDETVYQAMRDRKDVVSAVVDRLRGESLLPSL